MKWMVFVVLVFITFKKLDAQIGKVGINTNSPAAMLHVKDSSVVFTGATVIPFTPGSPPVSGAGTRMMWYSDKAAFRMGYVSGTQWDKANVGSYSLAQGYNTRASGSIAVALGNTTTASGSSSFAFGNSTTASALASTAWGTGTISNGLDATAWGFYSKASGEYATAFGETTIASGRVATAFGGSTIAKGDYSVAMGFNTIQKSIGLAIGRYNDTLSGERLFQIGNGFSNSTRSNAMTVNIYGQVGIGTTYPAALLHAKDGNIVFDETGDYPYSESRLMWINSKKALRSGKVHGDPWNYEINVGNYSVAFGSDCIASGPNSIATGLNTTASGNASTASGESTSAGGAHSIAFGLSSMASGSQSTAMGFSSKAIGYNCTALGENTLASGSNATAMGNGTIASGNHSYTFGFHNKASGNVSSASGVETKSKSYAGTVIGTFNDSTNAANSVFFDPANRLFQIGNGTANNLRSNAMTVLQNGNVGIGITVPGYILDVAGRLRVRNGVNGTAGVYMNKNDNSGEAGFIGMFSDDNYMGMYGNNGAGWFMLMNTTNGNVGIGTTPSEKLHVAGSGLFAGTVTANCGVLVCSDNRYKKNILPIKNALTSLQSIHGIYYNWDLEKCDDKGFNDERQIGFSAQELEIQYPEMVHTDAAGYKTVDYSRLTPVLVEAIKEQQTQIEKQQVQLEEQGRKIEMLMREMQSFRLTLNDQQ